MAVDPIISDLQYVMETSQELDILNFHKGFPITCKAQVESIDRDSATLRVQPPGSVTLESQEYTIVLSRGLPEAVRARIVSFDLASGTLRLSDFSYVGSHFGERMIARVQPDEIIRVDIDAGEQAAGGGAASGSAAGWVTTAGTLVDVSLSGVGVYTDPAQFERGQLLILTLPLPEGKVTLPGKVLGISEAPGGQVRLSIGFTRNAQEITVVMRYIKDRRSEILAEVERMYEEKTRKES